ncbi:MAG: hypothetical protein RL248_214, partial [Pseudomonadota bacterium]
MSRYTVYLRAWMLSLKNGYQANEIKVKST